MKKNLCALLTAVLVIALVCAVFPAPSFALRKLGDVDGNGKIEAADARLALRASVKLETLTAEQTLAANVDGDAFVTSADARLILRAAVKLETLPDTEVGDATPTDAARSAASAVSRGLAARSPPRRSPAAACSSTGACISSI